MVFEDLKHFETLVIISCTGILEEKSGVPPVLQCGPDLALPELAGEGVPQVRNKGRIKACRRIAGETEPVKDELARLKVAGGILDRGKSEGGHSGKGDRARRGCPTQLGGRK